MIEDGDTWVHGNLKCSEAFNNELIGQYQGNEYGYVEYKLKKCTEQPCKTKKEVEDFFNENYLNIIYKDQYLDAEDPYATMKTYIENRQYEILSTESTKHKRFFIQ